MRLSGRSGRNERAESREPRVVRRRPASVTMEWLTPRGTGLPPPVCWDVGTTPVACEPLLTPLSGIRARPQALTRFRRDSAHGKNGHKLFRNWLVLQLLGIRESQPFAARGEPPAAVSALRVPAVTPVRRPQTAPALGAGRTEAKVADTAHVTQATRLLGRPAGPCPHRGLLSALTHPGAV